MITPNNNNGKSKDFVISEYVPLLGEKTKEGKYPCPACGGHNLSIHKDGKKYTCFDGCNGNRIAYILREMNGEFKSTKSAIKESLSQKSFSDKPQSAANGNLGNRRLKTVMEVQDFLDDNYQNRIAYNLRFNQIEVDSQILQMDCLRADIGRKYRLDISAELLRECFLEIALRNAYDPVRNYLDTLPLDNIDDLRTFAAGLLHIDDELHLTYIEKWLIGCVARIYESGCKFDEALILQGRQGIGKSSFFQLLAGSWFSDSMTGKLDTDDLRIMNENWILEWGELDGYTAREYNAKIKRFLSAQCDTYRLPYGRDMMRVPRRSVIVGTTNRDDFLKDPTGNRRFWIVPITKEIDLQLVKDLKNHIWASAIAAYKSGKDWKLPRKLWKAQAEDNLNYEQSDPWQDVLTSYLETQEGAEVLANELLQKIEDAGMKVTYSRSDQMRVADILRKEGWESKRVYRGSKQIRAWIK